MPCKQESIYQTPLVSQVLAETQSLNQVILAGAGAPENPEKWQTNDPENRPWYYWDFRRLLARRFPCRLFYRVERGRMTVFRILPSKREPQRPL